MVKSYIANHFPTFQMLELTDTITQFDYSFINSNPLILTEN